MDIVISFFNDNLNKAIGAGIYQISIECNKKRSALYIGQSCSVIKRCATHLYELKEDPKHMCLNDDIMKSNDISLIFELLESQDDESRRLNREKELILQNKPLTQPYGPNDNQDKEIGKKCVSQFLKSCE